MTLLYIYILWVTACMDSISADSLTESAQVGSTVILKCNLSKEFTQTTHIRWHANNKFVFERSSKGMDIGPGYEGRVDVPEDELLKGNCSLVLKNVIVKDTAFYRCYVVVKPQNKCIIGYELSVKEKPEMKKDEPSPPSGEAGMNCPHLLILIISFLMCLLFSLVIGRGFARPFLLGYEPQ